MAKKAPYHLALATRQTKTSGAKASREQKSLGEQNRFDFVQESLSTVGWGI
jgi:hypothetical protein